MKCSLDYSHESTVTNLARLFGKKRYNFGILFSESEFPYGFRHRSKVDGWLNVERLIWDVCHNAGADPVDWNSSIGCLCLRQIHLVPATEIMAKTIQEHNGPYAAG
ncbi:hypothetical protein [Acaryochloris sp. CCMEE 5410]|uniref:hypothetical protein n=1 Tax=Acaryochloris sp. CCMEE 5410 TaxID=310037 RepID=UPI0002483B9F|nr:hypothetical protein [Acaryochloris sp. CCMEE 5410]KAI9133488.1 hypothetical protein ON05_009325 [Acaryochloris sp. CCMEE 5410]